MKPRLALASISIVAFIFCNLMQYTTHFDGAEPGSDSLYAAFQKPGNDAKPFVYWWWKGNDATKEEISRQLDLLHKTGVAGVHVFPLDKPTSNVEWLSAEWWRLVRFAADEAKKRDMQVDVNAGYGWPNSGTFIRPEHRLQAVSCVSEELTGPQHYEKNIADILIQTQIGDRTFAFARLVPRKIDRLDQVIDLREHVKDRTLSFDVPKGDFILYVGIHRTSARSNTRFEIKGLYALDYFDKEGVRAYLDHLAKTSRDALGVKLGDLFHAFFVSSVEIWPANWTTGFENEFRRRRGYDLMPYAHFATGMYNTMFYEGKFTRPDLFTAAPALADLIRRVRYDYNKTLVELFSENFVQTTQDWCREQGIRFRYQAYGYPWNIGMAENYMIPDIPEGNNVLLDNDPDEGWEKWNMYAAAGAHLTGKHLISCEAMTTQKGKFHETLDLVKRADDLNFVTGNTRSVVHGFCYSPASAPPPGWDKYGTFLSEHNPWWPFFPRWVEYNARLSQIFQLADPVIDVAILCPTADVWSDFGLNNFAQTRKPPYGHKLWESLSQQGLSADYLHEAILQKAKFAEGKLSYGPMTYNLLILCDVESLEPETAEAIERYVQAGGRLIVIGKAPARSPSLTDAAARDQRVKSAFENAVRVGGNRVTLIAAPDENTHLLTWTGELLHRTKTARRMRFSAPSPNLFQIHYRVGKRDIVFFCNQRTESRVSCRVVFPQSAKTPWRWDLFTSDRAIYPTERSGAVPIDLAPAESLLLVLEPDMKEGPKYVLPPVPGNQTQFVKGPWNLKLSSFRGEKKLLADQKLIDFAQSPALKDFAGVVEYQTTFEVVPGKLASMQFLDLGKINGVSEAWINGQPLGVRWFGLHQYPATGLKAGTNQLRVKVSTLLFNGVSAEGEPKESTGLPGPVWFREKRK